MAGKLSYYWVPVLGTGSPSGPNGTNCPDPWRPDLAGDTFPAGTIATVITHDKVGGRMLIGITAPEDFDDPKAATAVLTHTDVTSMGHTKHHTFASGADGANIFDAPKE